MKVAFVSRWGVQCGIATYTDQLSLALMRAGIEVECIAEEVTHEIGETEVQAHDVAVTRCWRGNSASYMGIFEQLQKSRPDIIHLQHEFGLMPTPKALIEPKTTSKTPTPTWWAGLRASRPKTSSALRYPSTTASAV